MPRSRVLMLTALAMLAFAGNSLLCRLALTGTTIDAASFTIDVAGVEYAIASGALASGVGYAIWYTALKGSPAASAATVQLSVPVIATIGGVIASRRARGPANRDRLGRDSRRHRARDTRQGTSVLAEPALPVTSA